MKQALVTLLCVAFATANLQDDFSEIWQKWKSDQGRSYNTVAEESMRYKIFVENAKMIQKHNLEQSLGLHTYTMELNKFGDMSEDEYRATMLPSVRARIPKDVGRVDESLKSVSVADLPSSVNWATKGVVTPIKNQGNCGSCWSFSATGVLEGQYALKHKNLLSFSEQQLVDCNTRCYGCDGGYVRQSYKYWEGTGSNLESAYPYQAHAYACRTQGKQQITKVSGWHTTQDGDETSLQTAVAEKGPISVAIDASLNSFSYYKTGIYYESKCKSNYDSLDHSVLAVGYGENSDGKYWIVKNSWGSDWGQEGYIYMARDRNNNCGIATDCSYPTLP